MDTPGSEPERVMELSSSFQYPDLVMATEDGCCTGEDYSPPSPPPSSNEGREDYETMNEEDLLTRPVNEEMDTSEYPAQRMNRQSSIAEEEMRPVEDSVAPEVTELFQRRMSITSDDSANGRDLIAPDPVVINARRRNTYQRKQNDLKMLTSSQLADLFRRLDNDNNGELDLAEFLAMAKKLNLSKSIGLKEDQSAEEYMKSIFREVDIGERGTLDIEQFISAYLMIYNRTSKTEARRRRPFRKQSIQAVDTEVITAIRYGKRDKDEFIFEVYNGRVSGDFEHFEIFEKRVCAVMERDRSHDCPLDDFKTATDFNPMSLEGLNQLVVSDAKANQDNNWSIFWWIDIAMETVSPLKVNKYVAGLGLPNESKFMDNFNTFGVVQPSGEKSHMVVGNGTSALGSASSVSFFTQSMWLKNVPLVRCIPEWIDSLGLCLLGRKRHADFKRYYETRFAFFFAVTWPKNKLAQYTRTNDDALAFANRLCSEDDSLFPEEVVNSKYSDWKASGGKKWDKFKFTSVSPENRGHDGHRTYDEPKWLLAKSHMDNRPSRVVYNNISLSLINQSYGTSVCVSIRKIDNEGKTNVGLDVQAQLGIMGRIITAVRIKLLESIVNGGITHTCVIHEQPAEIAGFIMNLVHNFSMNTLGTLSSWMNLLSREVNELTVSKHFAHSESMRELFDVITEVVNKKHRLLVRLHKELVDLNAVRVTQHVDTPTMESDQIKNPSMPDLTSPEKETRARTTSVYRNFFAKVAPTNVLVSAAILRPEVVIAQNVPADVIEDFIGFDFRKRISFVGHLLDGDSHLEVKGLSYFRERLERFGVQLDKLDERMQMKDDQKRNFFSFLLTVSTVFLAPLAALTGYWGMNFDNMKELDHTEYPVVPGIQLMWVSAGLIYAFLLFMSIHFRILYSAM